MEYIGIDVHRRDSQVCVITLKGEVLEQRIRTERKSFAELFGKRSRARILIEASTESEWVARCLEGLGHEVVVGDPNFAPMYASRDRRVKIKGHQTKKRLDLVGAPRPRGRGAYRAGRRRRSQGRSEPPRGRGGQHAT
jgi:transposase